MLSNARRETRQGLPIDPMADSPVCEFLQWDTDFFGVRIGRVTAHSLTAEAAQNILEWQSTNSIDCLYFLAEFDDPDTICLAEANGFHLVDVRITLECELKRFDGKIPGNGSRAVIRPAQSQDLPVLERIARVSHADTRFHFDRNFPQDKSESLYGVWIRRSCEGFADQVLVAELDGQAVGYITCKQLNAVMGQIGLVGVGEQARGQGIGKSLVYAGLKWFAARGLDTVQVVTQGRNISAQHLYQHCGFITHSLQLWYHRWASRFESQTR